MSSKAKKAKKAAKKAAKSTPKKIKKKTRNVDTWKTKRWYTIKAPKAFEEKELGGAISSDPKLLTGRKIRTTLREITGNIPHQNVTLRFKVTDVKGESLTTVPVGFELNRGYTQRQTRRMHSVLNTITDVTTKDKYKLRIKTLSFGHGKMRVAQEKEVRRLTEEYVKNYSEKTSFEKVFTESIYGKIGSEIFKSVKKIYPLTKTQIIKIKVLSAPEETK